jgi:hypothetical protein
VTADVPGTDGPAPTTAGTVTSIVATIGVIATTAAFIAEIGHWTATRIVACIVVAAGEMLVATGIWMTYEDFADRRPKTIVAAAARARQRAGAAEPTPDEIRAVEAGGAEAHALPPSDLVKAIGEAIKDATEGLSKLRPATQLILLGLLAIVGSTALFRLTP